MRLLLDNRFQKFAGVLWAAGIESGLHTIQLLIAKDRTK